MRDVPAVNTYFGLRDYSTATWEGGDSACGHTKDRTGGIGSSTLGGGKGTTNHQQEASYRQVCGKCGAVRIDNQIGLEETPDLYIAALVDVFKEVKRILRPDGVLFVNIGDGYFGDSPARKSSAEGFSKTWDPADSRGNGGTRRSAARIGDLKPKDLIGIPWMLAFALRADGWWLREEIIWAKGRDGDIDDVGPGNCMPESAGDRCTRSHEQVFVLTKQPRYYRDMVAIAEPSVSTHASGNGFKRPQQLSREGRGNDEQWQPTATRNARSVWMINTQATKLAHYATMPERLVERCILSGTSAAGACSVCGSPYARVVEREASNHLSRYDRQVATGGALSGGVGKNFPDVVSITTGWQPTCPHADAPTQPCVVLDCFGGSGTTGKVATKHGRDAILIELSPEYCEQAERRNDGVQTMMDVSS